MGALGEREAAAPGSPPEAAAGAAASAGEPTPAAEPVPGAAGASAAGRALVFIGFMGAGKSSAARTAAAELGAEPLDSDRELERELGEPLEDFFDREGEAAFRAREEEVALRLLARPEARVVALGGWSVGSERVREALRGHVVAHLEVDPADAWHRTSGKGRPLARDRTRFDQLHRDRRTVYDALADAVLPAADRGVVHRALPALLGLREDVAAGRRARLVWAASPSGDRKSVV